MGGDVFILYIQACHNIVARSGFEELVMRCWDLSLLWKGGTLLKLEVPESTYLPEDSVKAADDLCPLLIE